MAYGSTKSISDSILSATDGESIQEEIDVYMQSTASGTTGDGLIAAATINKNTDAAVTAMRRKSLGARKSQATAQETVRRDKLASVGRDWTALLMGVEEEDAPINATLRSDMMAKEASSAPQTANEAYLQRRELPTDGDRPDVLTPDGSDNISGSGASEAEGRFDDEPATTTTTPATTSLRPKARGLTTTPATTSLMSRPYDADRMKDINESPVFKNYKYNLINSTSTDNDVKNVQGMLTELGYKAGKADNVSGPGTERALRKFQAINGLTINGKLDDETMAKLKSSDVPLAFPDPPKKDAIVTELLDTDLEIFNTEVGKIESGNAYTYYKYDTPDGKYKKGDLMYGGAGGAYLGRYQMGTAALKDSGYNTAKKHYNMTKAQKDAFIKDPDLQDAEFKKYTKKNHIHLTKNSQAYRDMTKEEKLGILGYAHNQGATAAEEYLVTGVSGSDAFGTKGTKYTDALRVAFAEQVRTQSKAQ